MTYGHAHNGGTKNRHSHKLFHHVGTSPLTNSLCISVQQFLLQDTRHNMWNPHHKKFKKFQFTLASGMLCILKKSTTGMLELFTRVTRVSGYPPDLLLPGSESTTRFRRKIKTIYFWQKNVRLCSGNCSYFSDIL